MNRRNFLATAVGALGAALIVKKSQAATSIVAEALPAGPLRGKNQHMAMLDEISYHGVETGRWSGVVSHNVNWDLAVLSLYPYVLEVTKKPDWRGIDAFRLIRRNGIDNETDTSTPSQEVTKKLFRASLVWSQKRVPWRNGSKPEYTVIKSRWCDDLPKDGRVSREKLLELFTECMQRHVGINYSFPGNYMQDGMTASDRELWRAACADPQSSINRALLTFTEEQRKTGLKNFRPDLSA